MYDHRHFSLHPLPPRPSFIRFLTKISRRNCVLAPFEDQAVPLDAAEARVFTYRGRDGSCKQRPDRPVLVVSGTSWTPDEEFRILLLRCKVGPAVMGAGPSMHTTVVSRTHNPFHPALSFPSAGRRGQMRETTSWKQFSLEEEEAGGLRGG